jgi:hypothetical protein
VTGTDLSIWRRRGSEGRYSENGPPDSRQEEFVGWRWPIKPNSFPCRMPTNPRLASINRTSHQTADRGLSLATHAASPIFKRCPEERSPLRCEASKVRGEIATARRKLGHTCCEITILWTQLRLRRPALGSVFSARQAIIAWFQGASSKPTASMAQEATYRAPVPFNPKNWRAAVEPTVVNTWVNPCHLLARNRSRADAYHIRKGGHTSNARHCQCKSK